jgi:hypothetical protein
MAFRPSRRFLFLPAWTWFLFAPLIVGFAWLLGRPGELPEPKDREQVLLPAVVVSREADSFHFVPWDDPRGVTPLWAVGFTTSKHTETTWNLGVGKEGGLGFWKRAGRWRYDLVAIRSDKAWKAGEPAFLPAEDVARLRPLVIEELDRRSPGERRGDRLAGLLEHGLDRTSFVCVQNAVILLAWLSLAAALLGFVAMFIGASKQGPAADLQG